MHIVLFGATGRSGRLIAQRAEAAGHRLTSVVRPGSRAAVPGMRVEVDPADAEAVRSAASEADAVVSALASGKANPVCSRLAAALADQEGLRYVTIGGAGVDAPGDAKGIPDRLIGALMRLVVGEMLADRQAEHDLLTHSSLRWTMLRPPRLTDATGTGGWKLTYDRPATSSLPRADLAAAVIAVLDDPGTVNRAPFVATG